MRAIRQVIVWGAVLGILGACAEIWYLNGVIQQLELENAYKPSYVLQDEDLDVLHVEYVKLGGELQPALGVEWIQGGEDNMDWVLQ